jgi:hypothetical protein
VAGGFIVCTRILLLRLSGALRVAWGKMTPGRWPLCRQHLNQAASAGLARKARTPSMKASVCGSVPMVTRHQFS